MKIRHITASYKPAFIYGGPIYSVAALCEVLEAKGDGKLGIRKYTHLREAPEIQSLKIPKF